MMSMRRALRYPLAALRWPAADLRARWSGTSPFARDIAFVLVLKLVLLVILWAVFFRGPAVALTADAKAALAVDRVLGPEPKVETSHADR